MGSTAEGISHRVSSTNLQQKHRSIARMLGNGGQTWQTDAGLDQLKNSAESKGLGTSFDMMIAHDAKNSSRLTGAAYVESRETGSCYLVKA